MSGDVVTKRMLRWASGIMIVLGVGHLTLLTIMFRKVVFAWFSQGLWAAVPLLGARGVEPTVDSVLNKVTFWGGPGSFSVPLVLLGCLTWNLAGRGVALPAFVGWGIAAWCVVGGVLLVPSPFFVGTIAGVLIIVAARRPSVGYLPRHGGGEGDRENPVGAAR